MQVGEICHATLPPEMAYGAEGWPPKVPGGATIEMDLELMGFTPAEVALGGCRAERLCFRSSCGFASPQVLQDEARKTEAEKVVKLNGKAIDVEVSFTLKLVAPFIH